MKHIKFIGIMLALLFLATIACKKEFLEVSPTASFRDDKLTTKAGIEGALVGTYSILTGRRYDFYAGSTNWFWGGVLGGDANKGSNSGDQSQMNEVQRYATQSTNTSVYNKYATTYEGIVRANLVLSSLAKASEPISDDDKKRITGEAIFLRGHYYFELKKVFNKTPYLDENTGKEPIKNDIDLWPKIEADFVYAYNNLPEKQDAVGRANKWAAGAYMAKVYLYQGKYAEAKKVFDEVIAKGKTSAGLEYGLMEKYGDLFQAATSDNNKESVFSIQAAVGTGSAANANGDFMLNYPYKGGPAGCCGFNQPSFDLVNSFRTAANGLPLLDGTYNNAENKVKSDMGIAADSLFVPDTGNLDPRLDYSVGRRGIPYWNWGLHLGKSWIRDQAFAGPYSPKKFVYNKGDATDVSSWNNLTGNNYSIIRFADVLLMAAEAEVEAGTLEKARDYVNRVRVRAQKQDGFVKTADGKNAANYLINLYNTSWTDQVFARNAIRFERKLELSGEGHRFFDLIRWGIVKPVLDAYAKNEAANKLTESFGNFDKSGIFKGVTFTENRSEYQPIPQQEIDLVGSNILAQNKGY